MTTNSPGLFGCKKIYFQHPFHGKQQVKIFASFGHNIRSSGHRYGGAVWVESVSTSGFTACVLEFGDGSNSTSEINWLALQSLPLGTQLETAHLNAWTTGTKCTTIKFKQVRFLISNCLRQLWQMKFALFSIKQKLELGWSPFLPFVLNLNSPKYLQRLKNAFPILTIFFQFWSSSAVYRKAQGSNLFQRCGFPQRDLTYLRKITLLWPFKSWSFLCQ